MWVKSRRQKRGVDKREESVLSRGATGKNETSFLLGFCFRLRPTGVSAADPEVCGNQRMYRRFVV